MKSREDFPFTRGFFLLKGTRKCGQGHFLSMKEKEEATVRKGMQPCPRHLRKLSYQMSSASKFYLQVSRCCASPILSAFFRCVTWTLEFGSTRIALQHLVGAFQVRLERVLLEMFFLVDEISRLQSVVPKVIASRSSLWKGCSAKVGLF